MAGFTIETQPTSEPVSLDEAKNFLRVDITDDDDFISLMITAARESCEAFCNRSFATKGYLQTLDAFPYFADSQTNQGAYPPSYYSSPNYSTLWNYSQMIKLFAPPAIAVQSIEYIKPDGTTGTLAQNTDFVLDNVNEPARIFPMPGGIWPPCQYLPNAVRIHFTAGYGGDGNQALPVRCKIAMLQLLANWYENREAAMQGNYGELPNHIQMLLYSMRVFDVSPTRG
ncbi:MAG: head-tail connector protein [Terriglobales bacterium]